MGMKHGEMWYRSRSSVVPLKMGSELIIIVAERRGCHEEDDQYHCGQAW